MRYDIMMMWSDEKPPGTGIFEDLREAGAVDVLRNGTVQAGGAVFFTTYATLPIPATTAKAFANVLLNKYDLEVVELTWNPPDFVWAFYNWCLTHNFQGVVDAMTNLIEKVSQRWLR